MRIQSKKLISFLTSTSMTISALSLSGFSAYAETNSTSPQTSENQYSKSSEYTSSKAYCDAETAYVSEDLTSYAKYFNTLNNYPIKVIILLTTFQRRYYEKIV